MTGKNVTTLYTAENTEEICIGLIDEYNIQIIRYGAHTLQLAVNDFLKLYEEDIREIRFIAKSLRIPTSRSLFSSNKTLIPVSFLDESTIWGSTYYMLCSVLKCRCFIKTKADQSPQLHISEDRWCFFGCLKNILAPLEELIIDIHYEDLVLSEYALFWKMGGEKLSVEFEDNPF